MSQQQATSTRPYFIRAVHEWCTDNGYTPYIVVKVDQGVQVPVEYVNKGEIVLNVSVMSTGKLELGNDYIRFQARFAGVSRQVVVPVDHVVAIYARENGQGMSFPPPETDGVASPAPEVSVEEQEPAKKGGLHLVDEALQEEKGQETLAENEKTAQKPLAKPTFRIVD